MDKRSCYSLLYSQQLAIWSSFHNPCKVMHIWGFSYLFIFHGYFYLLSMIFERATNKLWYSICDVIVNPSNLPFHCIVSRPLVIKQFAVHFLIRGMGTGTRPLFHHHSTVRFDLKRNIIYRHEEKFIHRLEKTLTSKNVMNDPFPRYHNDHRVYLSPSTSVCMFPHRMHAIY